MKKWLLTLLSLILPIGATAAGGAADVSMAFEFEVYAGNSLLWKGALPADKSEVTFPIAATPAVNGVQPFLIVRRDLAADPAGRGVYFAEAQLLRLRTFKSGDNTIQMPEMQMDGVSAVVGEVGRASVSLKGDTNDYRFVVWQQGN